MRMSNILYELLNSMAWISWFPQYQEKNYIYGNGTQLSQKMKIHSRVIILWHTSETQKT